MQYLIDTDVLLMWLIDSPVLDRDVWGIIGDPHNEVLVSSVTALDIVERKLRKEIDCPSNLEGACVQSGFKILPLHFSHVMEFEKTMRETSDAIDVLLALLISQAKIEALTLITTNSAISRFNVSYILHQEATQHSQPLTA